MTLERYCRGRMVVLSPDATAAEAARAMDANHVGAVVVAGPNRKPAGIVTDRDLALRVVGPAFPPRRVKLSLLMTRHPVTLDASETEERAAELMQALRVRRIVLTREGQLAGLVSLDDLVLSGETSRQRLSKIVRAQLSEPSASKPEGFTRPTRLARALSTPALRREAHREQTMRRFGKQLAERLGLSSTIDAVTAFEVVVGQLAQRLSPEEAKDLLAQLPMRVREHLADLPRGPDVRITRERIEEQVAAHLGLDPKRASALTRRVGQTLGDFVSAGELADVVSQLPPELKPLLRRAA